MFDFSTYPQAWELEEASPEALLAAVAMLAAPPGVEEVGTWPGRVICGTSERGISLGSIGSPPVS